MRKSYLALAIPIIAALSAACTTTPSGPPPGTLQAGTCYSFTVNGVGQSFRYLGPANTLGNSLQYDDSTDCSTTPLDNSQTSTMSGQADQAAANATCDALLSPVNGFVSQLSVLDPITPQLNSADYWGCLVL